MPAPDILLQDRHFVILNKPAGLPVYSSNPRRPSVESLFPLLSRRKDGPWLVHRLDTDTAGCLVIALRKQALVEAQQCMAQHTARKVYWAVVRGRPFRPEGNITSPLLKKNTPQGWYVCVDPQGKMASTDWRVMGERNGLTWLELSLHTGRTHQARVHCASIGCPIVGDPLYGAPSEAAQTMHLLSRAISLPLEPQRSAIAPVPPHMTAALRACGWHEGRPRHPGALSAHKPQPEHHTF